MNTALDLEQAPQDWVKKHLTITGLHTKLELGQVSCIPFEETPTPAKSLVCSRSFGTRIAELSSLEEALSSYVQRAAQKLRAKKLLAGAVQVFLETNRFQNDPQYFGHACQKLSVPTSFTPDLHAAALGILRAIHRDGFKYQKVGVMLLELVPEGRRQLSFMEPTHGQKCDQKTLMSVLDTINTAYGRDTMFLGSSGSGPKPWHMRQERRSPRYTTRWDELPVVR
ncbi:MAG: DUF4113 domain-containing protein [Clostridia bacterium]|nr:DUF4113 domain-containing protein [Clostridia bacterium]